MKTNTDNYTLPIERGFRFLLSDVGKTVLTILLIVVTNFLLIGLYILFSKFIFISYLVFLGLIGFGIYFIMNQLKYFSKHSKIVNPNYDTSLSEREETIHEQSEENFQGFSDIAFKKVKHMQKLLNEEGLSNKTVKDEDLNTFEDIPAYIRKNLSLGSPTGEDLGKLSKFTLNEDEFEERVKKILFDLFVEFTNELNSLKLERVHSLEYKSNKQIEKTDDRDIKKIEQLLTFLFEVLGKDFFNEKDIDIDFNELLDMEYRKTIHGKIKTHILHKPTH